MKALELFYECWLDVTKSQRYHDKWLTDETYLSTIKAQFPTVVSLGFDRGKMNRAISIHGDTALDDFTESNRSGRFRRETSGYEHIIGETKKKALSRKYEAIDSLEERAFAILRDLGMIELHPDPHSPQYDSSMDNKFVA
jgi:hypothetical protein